VRARGKKALRLVGAATAFLLLLELLLQGFYRLTAGDSLTRRMALPIFAPDATRCYRLQADLAYLHRTTEFSITVYTNAQGLRTDRFRRPLEMPKPEGTYRVLFLGPSLAMGWGSEYEQSYAALIGAGLGTEGRRVEVVNLGTPGQSNALQLCWLRAYGRALRPDLIVQTVPYHPGWIDQGCPERRDCPLVEEGYLARRSSRWRRRLAELSKRSALVFYGWYLHRRYLAAAPASAGLPGAEVSSENVHPLGGESVGSIGERYAAYVRYVRDCVGGEVPIAFVFVPPSFVAHPEDLRRWVGFDAQWARSVRSLAAATDQTLRRHGILFVDSTPDLERSASGGRLYFWLDTHLTPAGNRVIAEATLTRLRESPPPPSSRLEGATRLP